MFHELCHNAHGPHNASFYKLWDELRKECEELMSKGITGTGEGFDLPGRRLGGFSRQPALSSLRQTALAAAENRKRLGSLLPSGPKRLGGDSTIKDALSPIQAAAMAAERRLQDDIWCASHCSEIAGDEETSADTLQDDLDFQQSAGSLVKGGSGGHARGETSNKRSHEPDENMQYMNNHLGSSFVDLIADSPAPGSVVNRSTRRSPKRSCKSDNLTSNQAQSGSSSSAFLLNNDSPESQWECESCTLLNPPLAPICEVCFTEKPKDIGAKYKVWSCKFCTLENSVKLDKCSACDQWRYSHGAPISTRAPNVGT